MDSRMDRIRKFMLQEEEDDDELFLVLIPAIYSSLYEEKRPVHTSSLSGAQLVKEILEGHESWSKVEFRMEPEIFRTVVDLTGEEASPTNSSTNQLETVNPLSSTHDVGQSSNMHGQEAQPTTSISSGQKEDKPVRKRKQSQIAVVLNDYVDFKKHQSQKFMEEMKEPKQTDQFNIPSCVAALETMDDLSIAEKSKALRLFKCQLNREIFLNTKDPLLRTFWLKEEISDMEKA
ncbi:hypothetical protein ACQ4PT_017834 [Festuca glaucescens]